MAEPKDADQNRLATGEYLDGSRVFLPTPEIPSDASDPFSINELRQLQERVRHQLNRIRDLEQALDQSLASLDELRRQIIDQQFLERQLASTEEIANVQQQAIHQLKLQFAQQKAELEAQVQQAQQREREYQGLLDSAESLAQEQQIELDRLKAQLVYDRSDPQTQQTHLEHQVEVLQADVDLRRQQIQSLESQKLTAQTCISELEKQVEELEGQIAKQLATQALLQQACQELELDREQSQHRIAELERQAAEMQEQILSQAQQASEYETAVQHWKNRFQTLQGKVATLKQLLEENLSKENSSLPSEVVELLAALETSSLPEPQATFRTNPFSEDLKIDVPEFLTKRRTYRRTQSQH